MDSLPEAGERIAQFRIVRKLGEGGMGAVFEAEDTKLGRRVALKLLPAGFARSPERRARLLREARAAAAVHHRSIATVHEIGEAGGRVFIAMELVHGETLQARIDRGLSSLDEALRITTDVVQGLCKAHAAGVVHRDLKPENIMLDADGDVKLLDFGIAKPFGDSAPVSADGNTDLPDTREGQVLGTPGYMSPEQACGERVDARSDLFSLGAVIYELLTGKRAFEARTLPLLLVATIQHEPSPLRELRPEISAEVEALVLRCLKKAADERFQSAEELLVELERIAAARTPASSERAPPGPSSTEAAASVDKPGSSAGGSRLMWLGVGSAIVLGGALAWRFAVTTTPALPVSASGAALGSAPPAASGQTPERKHRQLTGNTASNPVTCAALSPDGKYIAYADLEGGLFVEVRGTGERRKLPISAARHVETCSWAFDSTQLLVTEQINKNNVTRSSSQGEFWLRSVLSDEARPVGKGTFPVLSPDGKTLLFADAQGVHTRDLENVEVRTVHKPTPTVSRKPFGWSPSGDRIGLVEESHSGSAFVRLVTTTPTGDDLKVIYENERLQSGFGTAASWLPDGRIVFPVATPVGEAYGAELWSVRVSQSGSPAGPAQLLTRWLGSSAQQLSGTRNGEIAMVKMVSQTDVWVAKLAADGKSVSAAQRLTTDNRDDRPSSFTRDGRSVLFTSNRTGRWQLYRKALSGGETESLVRGVDWLTTPTLTPDGDTLLYWQIPVRDGQGSVIKLMRRPLAGGLASEVLELAYAHPLREHGRPEPAPRVHLACARVAGGDCVLIESSDGTPATVTLFNPMTGKLRAPTQMESPLFAALDAKGERLAVLTSPGELKVLEIASGKQSAVALEETCEPGDWTAAGDALIVFCDSELRRVDLDGKVSPLWKEPGWWLYLPVVAPDGKHVAVVARSLEANVWLLERAAP